MALSTKLGNIIPDDALQVSQDEALEYQKSVVRDWPIWTDTQVTKIFLRYGGDLAAGTTFVTSVKILDYFRCALKVQKKMYTYLLAPTFFISSYISGSITQKLITDNTLLMRIKCPICSQMKFALVQCYCGMVYPIMFSLGAFTYVGHVTGSYDYKRAAANPKEYWKQMYNFAKHGTKTYQLAGLLHSVLILSLPYMQAKELLKITEKLNEKNDELLEH